MNNPIPNPEERCIIHAQNGEICYRAFVLDGTGLSIFEYMKGKDPNFGVLLFSELHSIMGISVQTENEAEFHKHLDTLYVAWEQKKPRN